jgi:nucleotide-binding universal stress UspA family protein
MYELLTVATDGGPAADAAVRHASSLAAALGATLRVVYVVDTGRLAPTDEPAYELVESALEREGEAVVERAETVANVAGVEDVQTAVLRGRAHEAIVEDARETDPDVVVVGTQARRGVDRSLLGSVAGRVVRHAPVPVLVVRGPTAKR